MSGEVTGWVLRCCPVEGTTRMVLVVLADAARNDGTDAYPSVSTIAFRAKCSKSSVHRSLRELEDGGYIVRNGTTKLRTVNYTVVMGGSHGGTVPQGDRPTDGSDGPTVGRGGSHGETPDGPTVGPNTSKETSLTRPEREERASTRPPAEPSPPDLRGMEWQDRKDAEREHAARLDAHREAFNEWAAGWFPDAPPSKVAGLVDLMRVRGMDVDVDSMRAYGDHFRAWRLESARVVPLRKDEAA